MIAMPGVNLEHYFKVLQAREEMEYVSPKPSRVLSIKKTVYPNNSQNDSTTITSHDECNNAVCILPTHINVAQSKI